jgi:hypothetical protein
MLQLCIKYSDVGLHVACDLSLISSFPQEVEQRGLYIYWDTTNFSGEQVVIGKGSVLPTAPTSLDKSKEKDDRCVARASCDTAKTAG